jgi:biotin carboxylase
MLRVLVLSTTTGYQLRSFGAAAGSLGLELAFATDRCHALDDPWRDAAVAVRFHEEERSVAAITRAARERPLHGVLAVGDRPVVLAARAAAALGLRWHSVAGAAASGDKRAARQRLAAAGLPVPWHVAASCAAGIAALADPLSYPVVIKPVALSGSRGVIRADGPGELRQAFERVCRLLARRDVRALRTGREGELIVEGFIAGREYALEGVMTAGRLQTFAIFDKPDPLDGPFFEETIYVTPSSADAASQARMRETVERAAVALGLDHGPVHAECRVNPDGVFVLEIAARPIGGLCSRVLRFEGDEPLESVLLRHAVGEDVSRVRPAAAAAAVMMIPIPRRGVLKSVSGEAAARAVPHVTELHVTAKIDQVLEPLPEAGSYLGFIFAHAPSPAAAERAVREAHRCLAFAVDPAIEVRTGG